MASNDYSILRNRMVEEQLKNRGIEDDLILNAFKKVPRENFVPDYIKHNAYRDTPLPIGKNQTISQPYIIAKMMSMLGLNENDKVLEIGTGSGYQTALLCECADIVYSIERLKSLAKKSRKVLDELGYYKAHLITGDGTLGNKEKAPYDKIIISASGPKIPDPLINQLKTGGILVMPLGNNLFQQLIKVIKTKEGIKKNEEEGCRFVPLIGKEGWEEK